MSDVVAKKGLVVQYFSDLHLELKATCIPSVPVKGDVLVLAGDMGALDDGKLPKFMATVSKDFKDVVVTTGNREYYQWEKDGHQLSMNAIDEQLRKYYSKFPNVHFINCGTWTHPSGVDFHACTLWSYVPASMASSTEKRIFTYKYAYSAPGKRVTTADTNRINADHVAWLQTVVKASKKCVVATHHAPSFQLFRTSRSEVVERALATEMDEFIEKSPQIKLWICGHAHFIAERVIGETLCSMNCIGYPGDSPVVHFDKTFTVPL